MTRRVLVSGAGGFVGSAIVRRLTASGESVVPLRSRAIEGAPGFDLLMASVDDTARLVADHGITHAIHAAWYTAHADYLVADVNRDWLAASERFAHGFAAGGGERLVALGSCIEYDVRIGSGRFTESSPLGSDTLYGKCKTALAETLGASGIDHAWARLFFVYGPGDRAGRMLPYLIDRLSHGQLVVAAQGGVWRDYIHVDDLATQIIAVLDSYVQGPVNTGTGRAVRIGAVFESAAALFGRPDLVTSNDALAAGQVLRIEADMTRHAAMVGQVSVRCMDSWMATLVPGGHA